MAATQSIIIHRLVLISSLCFLFVSTAVFTTFGKIPETSSALVASVNPNDRNNINMASPTAAGTAAAAALLLVQRHVGKVRPESSVLLICDIQERFRPLIWKMETVVQTCRYLTSVAKVLHIPMVATQQYTKVFGPTIRDCFSNPEEDLQSIPIFDKKKFSMMTDDVSAKLDQFGPDRTSYIVCGIETHVCVQQTCLDLLERGADVHVIVDGVSSQQAIDREVALQRLVQSGAFVTTAQSMAYMLMHSADHPNFKAVSQLTVEHMKLPNEFNEALLHPSSNK